MVLAKKAVVVISVILVFLKLGVSGNSSSLPRIYKLEDSANSAGCTTAPDHYITKHTFPSELSNEDDNVLEVNLATFQSHAQSPKLDNKDDSISSAPKEQIPADMILETSTGQSNRFPSEILVVIIFIAIALCLQRLCPMHMAFLLLPPIFVSLVSQVI